MPRGRPRKSDVVLMKSAEFIGWALGGLEREIAHTRERLQSLTAQAARLREKVGGPGSRPAARSGARSEATTGTASGRADVAGGRKKRRRRMSPEARKRMSEMMKKRWAERRKKSS